MSLAQVCDSIAAISAVATQVDLTNLAKRCEAHLSNANEIVDAAENSLSSSAGEQRLTLWSFLDKLAKQHNIFLEALRSKVIFLGTHYAPSPSDPEWEAYVQLLNSSFSVLFGSPLVSLILTQLGGETGTSVAPAALATGRSHSAVTVHQSQLRYAGAFRTKAVAIERTESQKHTLQVKTLDSQMAMNVSSSYAPAKPVEILVAEPQVDADAPQGYMQALPSNHLKNYEQLRRKRLRDIMEKNREMQDQQQQEDLLRRVRGEKTATDSQRTAGVEFADIQMPVELPRDEYGVKRGNFPLGVRFIRDAIKSCGGAIELEVLVNRISTMANKEVTAEFGNVREFLMIHSPTFRLESEKDQWIVRLTTNQAGSGVADATWESIPCPRCSKVVKGRNLARHFNCRMCITAQIALGLQGDYQDRGPIAALAFLAKSIISAPDTLDDGDVDIFTECIQLAAEERRFRLASPRQFAPILKAMRVLRDRWLQRKGVEEVEDVVVDSTDASMVNLCRVFGRSTHRLPIAWIEMGDVIAICHRFSDGVLPPFNPPPRPADPRISLTNDYPGFLLCESEVDDEDDPSADEDEFSDDEAPAFTFAPPVDLAESLFTAGFDRDTKRLQHRMRTAPPMVLQRVLRGDRSQTQRDMYADIHHQGGATGLSKTELPVRMV